MFQINSAKRLKAGYEDSEVERSDPFKDWLDSFHFTYERPEEHSNHATLEATPHEVTLHLQNEGWEFLGDPETPPYKFRKDKHEVELTPAEEDRTKLELLDEQ